MLMSVQPVGGQQALDFTRLHTFSGDSVNNLAILSLLQVMQRN